jgi:hypothetical protein
MTKRGREANYANVSVDNRAPAPPYCASVGSTLIKVLAIEIWAFCVPFESVGPGVLSRPGDVGQSARRPRHATVMGL